MDAKDGWRGILRSEKPQTKETGATRPHASIRITRVVLASAAAVAVALGAGVASASIRRSHGKIPGCYPTLTGRPRAVEGQPGSRCPNKKHLYIAGFSNVQVGASSTQVAVLKQVPAGTYLLSVTGQATIPQVPYFSYDFLPTLTCSLIPSTTSYAPDSLPIGNPPIGYYTASIAAEGDSVLTTAGRITFSCQAAGVPSDFPSNPTLEGVITAIPVEGTN